MVGAYSGPQVRMDSSAPHWARVTMVGIAAAAWAWSCTAGTTGRASAVLVPGSRSATRTSPGTPPPPPPPNNPLPGAPSVQYGAGPARTSASRVCFDGVCSTSSGSSDVHSPHRPAASFTRSWTTTSLTSGSSRHVTPTLENISVSGWDTVSAGTPSSSSPDETTWSSSGAVDGVVPERGTSSSWTPSVTTTASPSGSLTDPSGISSMDASTGLASGTGAA